MAQTSKDIGQEQQLEGAEALNKVRALLDNFRSTLFTTISDAGVQARPMGLLGDADDFDGSLWFFTDDRSELAQEIRTGVTSTLLFQSDDDSAYLQLDGTATEDRDPARMKELFTPMLKTWFPDGLEEPHLTLLRFDASAGRFWDSPGGVFQLMGAFAKSVLTHEPARGGEKGKVQL